MFQILHLRQINDGPQLCAISAQNVRAALTGMGKVFAMKRNLLGAAAALMASLGAVAKSDAATYRYDYIGNPMSFTGVTGHVYTTSGYRFSVEVDEALLGDTVANGFSFNVQTGWFYYPPRFEYSWASDTQSGAEVRDYPSAHIDTNGGITLASAGEFTSAHAGALGFSKAADGSISWSFWGYYFDYASLGSGGGGDYYNSGQSVWELVRTGPGPQDYTYVTTFLNFSAPAGRWVDMSPVPLPATAPLAILALFSLAMVGRRRRVTAS